MLQLNLNNEEFEIKKLVTEELTQDESKLMTTVLNHLNASISISYIDSKIQPFVDLNLNNQALDSSSSSFNGVNYIVGNYNIKCELSNPFTFKRKNVLKYSVGNSLKCLIHFICTCTVNINIKSINGDDIKLKHLTT